MCAAEATDICLEVELKQEILARFFFQDSDVNSNAGNSTTFLATKTLSKEDNFSTTVPDLHIKSNGIVTLEESLTQGSSVSNSLVNNTASFNPQNPQDQCWETYVGQVCNWYIMSPHLIKHINIMFAVFSFRAFLHTNSRLQLRIV